MVDSLVERQERLTRAPGDLVFRPIDGPKQIIPKFLLILIYFADFFGLGHLIDRMRSAQGRVLRKDWHGTTSCFPY
jgi:hypothetical protein